MCYACVRIYCKSWGTIKHSAEHLHVRYTCIRPKILYLGGGGGGGPNPSPFTTALIYNSQWEKLIISTYTHAESQTYSRDNVIYMYMSIISIRSHKN